MRALALAREDVRLTWRSGGAVFWIFIAPFLWVYFFGFVNRPSDPTATRISLGVADEDGSPLSDLLVDQLEQQNFGVVVARGGKALPAGNDAPSRVLTIPAGFAGALDRRQKVSLDLRVTEAANPEATFATEVALHKAIMRVLATKALGAFPADKDAIVVRSSWGGRRPVPSGYYQTIPGNLVMFVLIATLAYGAALLAEERSQGILKRLAASPLPRGEILAGKLAGRALLAALQVGVFLIMSAVFFRIEWGRSPAGLALVLLSFVLCAASLSLLSGSLFRTGDAASGLGIVMVLAMSALGGCWWPSEVMPRWLQVAGHVFPTAWAMDGLHQILSWDGGLTDVLLPAGVLLAYSLGAGYLAVRTLRFAA